VTAGWCAGPRAIQFTVFVSRKSGGEQRQGVLSLSFGVSVKEVYDAVQVDAKSASELYFQIAEQFLQVSHDWRFEKLIELISNLANALVGNLP
jgi:hypothetical protein